MQLQSNAKVSIWSKFSKIWHNLSFSIIHELSSKKTLPSERISVDMILDKNGFCSWKTLFYVFLIYFCQMAVWLVVGFVGAKADSWMPKWKGRYKGHQGWAFLCMWVCNYGKTQCMCVSPLFKRFFSVLIFSKIAEICRISWFNRITFQVSSKLWNPGP